MTSHEDFKEGLAWELSTNWTSTLGKSQDEIQLLSSGSMTVGNCGFDTTYESELQKDYSQWLESIALQVCCRKNSYYVVLLVSRNSELRVWLLFSGRVVAWHAWGHVILGYCKQNWRRRNRVRGVRFSQRVILFPICALSIYNRK